MRISIRRAVKRITGCDWAALWLLLVTVAMNTSAHASDCQDELASRLPGSSCNRAFTLSVTEAEFSTTLAGKPAPPGRRWLTLDVRFENWMPGDLVFALGYQEALLVASLERQLYLLVDDQLVVRPEVWENPEPSGHLADDFILPRTGAYRQGKVSYAVPDQPLNKLSLHYYHDQYAPIRVTLLENSDARQASRVEDDDVQGHDLFAMTLDRVQRLEQWQGQSAPPGMQWLVADLRGQSRWRTDVDARALDVKADISQKESLSRVMEYMEAPGLIQVVADGRHAYPRHAELSSLADDPAFLPATWAGGQAVFAVPEDSQTLELVAYMPQFGGKDISMDIRPTLRFPIEQGEPLPPLNERQVIEDSPVPLALHEAEWVDGFADQLSDDEGALLRLEVSLRNLSEVGGMMNLSERLKPLSPDGEWLGTYLRGPLALEEPFWLPANDEKRVVTLLYRFQGAPADKVEMEYSGISLSETFTITPR